MISIAALLGLAASAQAPVAARAGKAVSVDAAMTSAIAFGCFLHASEASPIAGPRRNELAAAGLAYADMPPASVAADVASGMPSTWGKPSFAKVIWKEGMAWVIGFDSGNCLIDASSDDGPALVKALREQFEAPGVPWRRLPSQVATEQYAMAVKPPGKPAIAIIANVAGMDMEPPSRREVVTFNIKSNK